MKTNALRATLPPQSSFPGLCPVEAAVQQASSSGGDARGAIYTRPEVVDFILDLIGYTVDKPLWEYRLLEPSVGEGDFLIPAVERLLQAFSKGLGAPELTVEALLNCVRAIELHPHSLMRTRERLRSLLVVNGLGRVQAEKVLDAWMFSGDFLLTEFEGTFTHVIGNPPYIRQESIPDVLIAEYRRRHQTIYDRADIYIPFIEHSLRQLDVDGVLGFICADRWLKNKYGGPLRKLVAERFHLRAYIDMFGTPAFHSEVIAYPAITIIAREPTGPTRLAFRPEISGQALQKLAVHMLSEHSPAKSTGVSEIETIANGNEPWVLDGESGVALVRRLEGLYPTLEEAGCKVGIGVATGADQVFIAPFDELDVELDRKIPLAMTKDIKSGDVVWRGFGVLNPFSDAGGLVALDDYPKLKAYLDRYGDEIRKRHVSKKNPNNWYRTIDRIYPELAKQEKLLIPDIKGDAQIVFESGRLYPHHNLYYITSLEWDLRALEAVLTSGIARLFVGTYSTKMRGGYLRFQAQYLRRIRIPHWSSVSQELRSSLRNAAITKNRDACNSAVAALYGLTDYEQSIIRETK